MRESREWRDERLMGLEVRELLRAGSVWYPVCAIGSFLTLGFRHTILLLLLRGDLLHPRFNWDLEVNPRCFLHVYPYSFPIGADNSTSRGFHPHLNQSPIDSPSESPDTRARFCSSFECYSSVMQVSRWLSNSSHSPPSYQLPAQVLFDFKGQ